MPNLKRNKKWAYEVERAVEQRLRRWFPYIQRTGSVGYKRGAADLYQRGNKGAVHLFLVVTKEKGGSDPIVSMSLAELDLLLSYPSSTSGMEVAVQVKARSGPIWVHQVRRLLIESIRGLKKGERGVRKA